jgi:hypothetical protein
MIGTESMAGLAQLLLIAGKNRILPNAASKL